jgi:hypothetical protein
VHNLFGHAAISRRCECSIPRLSRILSIAIRSCGGGGKAAEQTKPVQEKSTPEVAFLISLPKGTK